MTQYLLVTTEQKTELDALNAAELVNSRQIRPVTTTDGRMVVGADLLGDADTSDTWAAYKTWLTALEPVELAATDFPTPSFPPQVEAPTEETPNVHT